MRSDNLNVVYLLVVFFQINNYGMFSAPWMCKALNYINSKGEYSHTKNEKEDYKTRQDQSQGIFQAYTFDEIESAGFLDKENSQLVENINLKEGVESINLKEEVESINLKEEVVEAINFLEEKINKVKKEKEEIEKQLSEVDLSVIDKMYIIFFNIWNFSKKGEEAKEKFKNKIKEYEKEIKKYEKDKKIDRKEEANFKDLIARVEWFFFRDMPIIKEFLEAQKIDYLKYIEGFFKKIEERSLYNEIDRYFKLQGQLEKLPQIESLGHLKSNLIKYQNSENAEIYLNLLKKDGTLQQDM